MSADRTSFVGRYRLIERIGTGGMAEVWRAVADGPSGFEKTLVVKRIRPEFAEDPEFVRMLVAEAKLGAELDHPNVVEVFDLGFADGTYFIVMQYVEGLDLDRFLLRRQVQGMPVPPSVIAHVGVEVLRALEHAHGRRNAAGDSAPLIHRDVSPPNILLSVAGTVKLADFGVARALDRVRLTRSGILKGKIGYMSPEHASGADLDPRTDLYSLGVVLWEALSGRRLFGGSGDAAQVRRVQRAEVPVLGTMVEGLDPTLAAAVHKALERDRDRRHPNAAAFRSALQAYLQEARPPVDPATIAELVRETLAGARPSEPEVDWTEVDPAPPLGVVWSEAPSHPGQETSIHARQTLLLAGRRAAGTPRGSIDSPPHPSGRPALTSSPAKALGRPPKLLLLVGVPIATALLSALLVWYRPVRARLRIDGVPAGTRVWVDESRAVPGTDGAVVVTPGRRFVRIVFPSGQVVHKQVVVPRGGETRLVVMPEAEDHSMPPASRSSPSDESAPAADAGHGTVALP